MWMEILGPWALAIAAGLAFSALVGLLLTVCVALKWRPPVWMWLLGPASTLMLGAIGTWSYGSTAANAIAHADMDTRPILAFAAYGEAVTVVGVAALATGVVLLLSSCALAVGIAASARPGRFTFAPAVLSALVAGVTFVVCVGFALFGPAGLLGLALAVCAGIAAFAPAVAGLRAAPPFSYDDEPPSVDPARVAAGRVAVALLSVLAVAALGWGAAWLLESQGARAMSMVDPTQKITVLAASIAEQVGVGRVWTVAMIGTLLAAAIPALWSSGDLGTAAPARNAIGALGAMVLLAVGLGIPAGLVSTLAPLLDVAGQAALIDAIGATVLPEPTPRSDDAWDATEGLAGGCVMTPSGTSWGFRPAGGGCPEGIVTPLPEEVVVAVPGDMPATGLARVRWGDETAELRVLVKRSDAEELPLRHPLVESMAYGVVPFVAPPATDAPPFPEVYIVETPEGAQIGWADRPSVPAPTDSDGLRGLVDAGLPVVLVPGASWTVQDLVGWCLDVRAVDPRAVCGLRAAAPLYEAPDVAMP